MVDGAIGMTVSFTFQLAQLFPAPIFLRIKITYAAPDSIPAQKERSRLLARSAVFDAKLASVHMLDPFQNQLASLVHEHL